MSNPTKGDKKVQQRYGMLIRSPAISSFYYILLVMGSHNSVMTEDEKEINIKTDV